jgi:cellulose biosynthesis protein BcsQ
MLTINALTAARELLIPMSMEYLALRGLDMLAKTVTKIRWVTNPKLSYLGILATKYDRRTLNSRPASRPRDGVIGQARTMGFSAQQGRQYRGIARFGQRDLAIN